MLSRTIRNRLKPPAWFTENKRLQAAILACAALLCADIVLSVLLAPPAGGGLAEREARYSQLKKLRTEAILFQKQHRELAGLKAGIPEQKDMPLLVKDLVQTARNLHLVVSPINYDIPKRSGDELVLLAFTFPAEGRYADIKRFIYEVETSDRLVGIQDLKLDSNEGRVKLDLKLVTYVKGQ